MKVTVLPIMIVVHFIITKGLVQGLEDLEERGQMETILTAGLLILARRFLKTVGDLLSLKLL